MNQGQFEAITSQLDRIIELLEAQHQLAQASMAAMQEAVDGLADVVAPAPTTPTKPIKRSKDQ